MKIVRLAIGSINQKINMRSNSKIIIKSKGGGGVQSLKSNKIDTNFLHRQQYIWAPQILSYLRQPKEFSQGKRHRRGYFRK